jgi:hypothetical protein
MVTLFDLQGRKKLQKVMRATARMLEWMNGCFTVLNFGFLEVAETWKRKVSVCGF